MVNEHHIVIAMVSYVLGYFQLFPVFSHTDSTSWGQWEVVMNHGFLMEPVAKLSILALIFVFLTIYICSFHGGELGRNWKGGYFQICINSKQWSKEWNQYIPLGFRLISGPVHLKAGFRPLSSVTWTFLIRSKLLRMLAISYNLLIFAGKKKVYTSLNGIMKDQRTLLYKDFIYIQRAILTINARQQKKWLFLGYSSDTVLIKTKKVLNIEKTQLLLLLNFEMTNAHVEKGKMTLMTLPS